MPTFLSEITQQLSATKAAPERNRRRRTYPKRHANTKKPSLGPRQVANRAHRPSWAHPNQSHPADAAQPALYTLTLLVPKLEKKGGRRDKLCLPAPEPYFVDGIGNGMLLGSQKSIQADCTA